MQLPGPPAGVWQGTNESQDVTRASRGAQPACQLHRARGTGAAPSGPCQRGPREVHREGSSSVASMGRAMGWGRQAWPGCGAHPPAPGTLLAGGCWWWRHCLQSPSASNTRIGKDPTNGAAYALMTVAAGPLNTPRGTPADCCRFTTWGTAACGKDEAIYNHDPGGSIHQ